MNLFENLESYHRRNTVEVSIVHEGESFFNQLHSDYNFASEVSALHKSKTDIKASEDSNGS